MCVTLSVGKCNLEFEIQTIVAEQMMIVISHQSIFRDIIFTIIPVELFTAGKVKYNQEEMASVNQSSSWLQLTINTRECNHYFETQVGIWFHSLNYTFTNSNFLCRAYLKFYHLPHPPELSTGGCRNLNKIFNLRLCFVEANFSNGIIESS